MKKRRSRSFFPLAVGVVLFVLQTPFGGWATQQPVEPPAVKTQPPVSRGIVYDDYDFNSAYYNTCFPQLDMAAQTLHENPSAICLIEGYRDRSEKSWVSKRRSENAKTYLVSSKGFDSRRILTQDRGFEKRPEGLAGPPRSFHSGRISKNGGIVISVYLPRDMSTNKLSNLPVVYSGYRKKSARYDSCSPHLDMAKLELTNDPNLICIIEGHRDPGESRSLSKKRSENAHSILSMLSNENVRIRSIDAGVDKKIWLALSGSRPRPFLGHTNRFIAIGLFYPVSIKGFQ